MIHKYLQIDDAWSYVYQRYIRSSGWKLDLEKFKLQIERNIVSE